LQPSPWLISGYYIDSDSDVATLGTLGVVGKGKIAGLRFIRPLPPLAGGAQRATFGLDYKDFEESIALTGNQPSIETPIQYGILNAGWGLNFFGEEHTTAIDVLGVFAPRFLGNDPVEFENKRTGARPSFAYLGVSLSQENELPGDIRLRFSGRVQLADSPLISNEQFSLGGVLSVRGYLESQEFMDNGYSGQLELLSPDWGSRVPGVTSGRLFAFADAGGGMLQDPLPEQDDDFFLWSAGVGLRALLWRHLAPEIQWAFPFVDSADESIQSGDSRWHFNVRYGF
jgi:hemolysin activation/secretion protein